jgi:aryl-alcohol dehydrogenase-like predicted oxidoreductase
MRLRTLGSSRVQVSEIGFGVWTVAAGWWGTYTDEQATALIRRAYDLGITFFDTADTYGSGRGETLLAKALEGLPRDRVTVGTKFGYDFYNHDSPTRGQRELPQDWSPSFVRHALEESLRRLDTEYIDVYQMHNPRLEAMHRDDLFALLEDLVAEGKIRAWGAALGPALPGTEHGVEAMRAQPRMHALQIIYNLLEQDPGRRFFPVADELGVSVLVRVPHSSGLLEGKFTSDTTFPPTDHRSHRPRSWLIEGLQKLERLRFLTEGRDMTIGQAALKFVLAEPTIASALPNIYAAEQLEEFAAASDKPDLTSDDLAQIADLYARGFDVTPVSANAPA